MLKMFASRFDSVQVNLSHLPALHRATQEVQVSKHAHFAEDVPCSQMIEHAPALKDQSVPLKANVLEQRRHNVLPPLIGAGCAQPSNKVINVYCCILIE